MRLESDLTTVRTKFPSILPTLRCLQKTFGPTLTYTCIEGFRPCPIPSARTTHICRSHRITALWVWVCFSAATWDSSCIFCVSGGCCRLAISLGVIWPRWFQPL